jgi:hypothetical protein
MKHAGCSRPRRRQGSARLAQEAEGTVLNARSILIRAAQTRRASLPLGLALRQLCTLFRHYKPVRQRYRELTVHSQCKCEISMQSGVFEEHGIEFLGLDGVRLLPGSPKN